ncbi:hypothetical protein EB001_04670 [bacterium]|nr:hypothetical protein [bacterium]
MGQFKPMVKMETTEPSVILKLKKGGSAHKKMKGDAKTGHKMMDGGMAPVQSALTSMAPKIAPRSAAPVARAPARPSFASRRRSMMPKVSVPPMKKGGKCYAEGGLAKSGIINTEDQGGEYRNTLMHSAEKTTKTSGKTGDVKKGNGGGYKTGGVVLGNGGGYKTGGVALGNGGGYKKGGSSKKAYASGGSVNDEGKATSMPQGAKKPSAPVAINMLSGTFKKGGNVTSKKLQSTFKKENAPALNASKAKLLDKYSPYQKADGGPISDSAYQSVMKAEKAGKKTMIDKPLKGTTPPQAEKRYPSGLTDSDIDKVLSSKKFQEGASHFSDYKRGGKAKK